MWKLQQFGTLATFCNNLGGRLRWSVVNYKPLNVRRLSTTSSVVAAAGHVFSTRWHWYWQDENNKWQSYDTPNDGHAASTTNSQCLEREFLAGRSKISLSPQIIIDFLFAVVSWCFARVESPNDLVHKIPKTLNDTPTTKQKRTNNGFLNTKKHPCFLMELFGQWMTRMISQGRPGPQKIRQITPKYPKFIQIYPKLYPGILYTWNSKKVIYRIPVFKLQYTVYPI